MLGRAARVLPEPEPCARCVRYWAIEGSCLLVPAMVLGAAALYVAWPYFFAFVGTDIGVYYEVSKRLALDGHLTLFGNYWDHKPILPYLAYLPFTGLDTPAQEFLGLRVGMVAIYAGAALLAMWSMLLAMPRRAGGVLVATAAAVCVVALGFMPSIDERQSGMLIIAGVCVEFASVMMLVRAVERASLPAALMSGFLAGTAPYWRPTSIGAGLLLGLLLILVWRRDPRTRLLALAALSTAFATGLSWLALTLAMGSSPGDVIATLGSFNGAYGAYFQSQTPIWAFVTQRPWTSWTSIAGASTVLLLLINPRRKTVDAGLPVLAVYFALVCCALSILSRKMEPFYAYYFACAFVLSGAAIVASVSARLPRLGLAAGLLACIGAAHATSVAGRTARGYVAGNLWCSNEDQTTGVIARELGAMAKPGDTLWICGNRAPLYEQARRHGLSAWDWTVFDTPLFSISDERFEEWFDRFVNQPPTFIVRLNNAQSAPWVDQATFRSRRDRINDAIARRYTKSGVPSVAGVGKPWPYGYTFEVLARTER